MRVVSFLLDAARQALSGGRGYWSWIGILVVLGLIGAYSYGLQYQIGPYVATGLSEEVAWGFYIANFAFLIGVAAAAVMLIIPGYIFHNEEIKNVVLVGEGMAAAACITAVLFILASLGRPDRLWHILPLIGRMNFPRSMLAWDVVVINFYLFLNISIPFYILFTHYRGREANFRLYFPGVLVSIVFAISIHTVTAFLFSSNISRPYWHTAILGPRFLASAFTSGPALIILALQVIRSQTRFPVDERVINTLAVIATVSLQINLFLLGAELFTEFYGQTAHSASIQYLFFGLHGHHALVPWIWTAVGLNLIAVTLLSIHPLRQRRMLLNLACVLTILGIWIEKGLGLVVPGFIPSPLGNIVEYVPTLLEIGVSVGIWAIGILIFTVLVKIALPIELGLLVSPELRQERARSMPTAARPT